jgi:glycosyltransferase involved in cell wall biosynthesis
MTGVPVVALATTEMVSVIRDGVNGFIHADPERLAGDMRTLLAEHALARKLGEEARRTALERFHIARFVADWNHAFSEVTGFRAAA